MKKSILNLGKALNKAAQKKIQGGKVVCCISNPLCLSYNEESCIVIAGKCHFLMQGEGLGC